MTEPGYEHMQNAAVEAQKVAELAFAHGSVGAGYMPESPDAIAEYGTMLERHTLPFTDPNTGFCMEGRRIKYFAAMPQHAKYPNMETYVRAVVAPQYAGGVGLHTTKALVAANLPILSDAHNFNEAYDITTELLLRKGIKDGGHDDCGASGAVENSVRPENQIHPDILVPAMGLFRIPDTAMVRVIAGEVAANKDYKLQAGFYGTWSREFHQDRLIQAAPQYFSYIEVDPSEPGTHGHHEGAVLAIDDDSNGFAKNAFIEATGQYAFAVTIRKMWELSYALGATNQERAALYYAFIDDLLHVSAGLVDPKMPVFASGTNADIVNSISFNN